MDFITIGVLDVRLIIPKFLEAVEFEEGNKFDHWVIKEQFYFFVNKKTQEERMRQGFVYTISHDFSTLVLLAIVGISVVFTMSYFTSNTVESQKTIQKCDSTLITSEYTCFSTDTLSFVDCSSGNSSTVMAAPLQCFKFFIIESELASIAATTFALYLTISTAVLNAMFYLIKILLKIYFKKKVWGVVLLFFGTLIFVAGVALLVMWIIGYSSTSLPALTQFSLSNLVQLFMLAILVMLVGTLMLQSNLAKRKTRSAFEEEHGLLKVTESNV